MFEYTLLEKCRLCKSTEIEVVFDLGKQYVVDFIPAAEVQEWKDGKKENPIPLSMVVCKKCSFVQLGQSVNPDRMYRRFWYRSGVNETMRNILRDITIEACEKVQTWNDMSVLDIGSNDGTLLSFYHDDVTKVGFDPAENLAEDAKVNANTKHIFADYFTAERMEQLKEITKGEGFKVITAIAMFYDLEDPEEFLKTIKRVLHKDGVFIIQMNYLLSMLQLRAIDNIAHEHLAYYSLGVLDRLVRDCRLEVIDAQVNDINGGSIRVTIGHPGEMQTAEGAGRIHHLLTRENDAKLFDVKTYVEFGKTMKRIVHKLNAFLRSAKAQAQVVYLYGASTRGSTLMQCLNKTLSSSIQGAAERNPEKYGHHMVGTWIPIVSEDEARKQADVFLVLPWHFKQAILDREENTMRMGTQFLFPLPLPRVYSVEML